MNTLDLNIRLAGSHESDLDILARMNHELIEDEVSRNRMPLAELKRRMAEWLAGEWMAALFDLGETPVGYILFQIRRDEYDPKAIDVYVRQFFVDRTRRHQGIGRSAFQQVRSNFFPESATVTLDVLAGNERAFNFWRAVGFTDYCVTMKIERSDSEHSG